jgi:hypothetical protein
MKVSLVAPVPVPFARCRVDGLARVHGHSLAAAGFDERDPVGYAEGLTEGVDVPGGSRPSGEADQCGGHPVWQRPGLRDRVDPHVAGEPFGRALPEGWRASTSMVSLSSTAGRRTV